MHPLFSRCRLVSWSMVVPPILTIDLEVFCSYFLAAIMGICIRGWHALSTTGQLARLLGRQPGRSKLGVSGERLGPDGTAEAAPRDDHTCIRKLICVMGSWAMGRSIQIFCVRTPRRARMMTVMQLQQSHTAQARDVCYQ